MINPVAVIHRGSGTRQICRSALAVLCVSSRCRASHWAVWAPGSGPLRRETMRVARVAPIKTAWDRKYATGGATRAQRIREIATSAELSRSGTVRDTRSAQIARTEPTAQIHACHES
jgi:hypothetical protein